MSRSTEAPYTKSSRLHLGAAPSCASGTTGSTHPGHGLARSGRVCVSEAPPPLLSVSVLSTYSETPFCCFSTDFISAGYPRRSYISTYAAHLRRSGTGDASPLCCILVSSEWSPDLTTTSISNHCSSLTLVNYLVGLVFAVCSPVFESVPARKGPYGDKPYRVYLMTSPSTTSFCAPSFYSLPHPGRETGRTVYVFPMCCVPTPIFWKMTQNHVARRPNHAKAFYLLLDVCSHTFNQNKCDDSMLRSLSVTTCWDQHGNVDFRGLDPIKPSALSSNLISLSASVGVKLELEIHLVSSVSNVVFKADCACFSVKSSQIGLRTLNVVYGSGASHLKLLLINIPTSSYRCINVAFDYQLFFGTITMGTKVELPFRFLHFAERDSPLNGSISSCFVMFSSFVLPWSLAPEISASVVNDDAL